MSKEASRRISFSADSVLTAVVQDEDTPELIRILGHHSHEIRVNQVNHVGLTALHHGVLSNNMDAVKLLLCNGADVNAQDVHGFSPLHTAAACGSEQIASLLVMNGADVFSLTKHRETPLDVAKDVDVVRLLGQEMRRHLHEELYWPCFVRRKSLETFWTCCEGVTHCVREMCQVITQSWRGQKSKTQIHSDISATHCKKQE